MLILRASVHIHTDSLTSQLSCQVSDIYVHSTGFFAPERGQGTCVDGYHSNSHRNFIIHYSGTDAKPLSLTGLRALVE